MHKTFQILNLGWFGAPQSFKSEKLLVTKHQIKNTRIAQKYELDYIKKNGLELEVLMKCSIEQIKACRFITSQNSIMSWKSVLGKIQKRSKIAHCCQCTIWHEAFIFIVFPCF